MRRTNEIKFEFDGLKFSVKTTYHENGGLNTIQTYLGNDRHGIFLDYDRNGMLVFRTPYVNDRIHGLVEAWYENSTGQKKHEINFKYGEYDGACRSWHRNGQLEAVATYKDGLLDGLYERFDEDGKLVSSKIYKMDEVARDNMQKD